MSYAFYFTHEGKTMQLPVNPKDLTVSMSGNNETTEIIKIGEINRLRGRKLAEIGLSSFFPALSDRSYVQTSNPPAEYIAFFESFLESTNAGRLVIAGANISIPCSVESFEHTKTGGNPDTNYTLSVKEYKPYAAKILQETSSGEVKDTGGGNRSGGDGFAVGDLVILNGPYFNTSYGEKPSYTASGMEGQIERINNDSSRPYRYHICRPQNTARWIGWVNESCMTKK